MSERREFEVGDRVVRRAGYPDIPERLPNEPKGRRVGRIVGVSPRKHGNTLVRWMVSVPPVETETDTIELAPPVLLPEVNVTRRLPSTGPEKFLASI